MNRMRRFCLPLLLAAPVGAQDLRQVYERHKAVMREFSHALKEMAREREAHPAAPDPEAHLEEWRASFGRANALNEEREKLWEVHDTGVRDLQLGAAKNLFTSIDRGENPLAKRSPTLYEDANHNELMSALQGRHLAVYGKEIDAFHAAEKRLQTRRATERQQRKLALGLLAVALASVSAAVLWNRLASARKTIIRLPPAAPSGPPPVPKLIAGNIAVKALIGRGAMGEVYEGLDQTIGRRVALKRLRPELLASPGDLEGLLAEARIVASLKHDNLVTIYSVEREAGQVYLAFEFVDGQTLARSLEERGRLSWPEALNIFRGVCAALHYAHGRRVVHRDLKPANIMLARTGEVKVMDFGIAFTAQKSISRLTRAAAWGTPPYMAPEQELGGVSAGVDLFAASVCLYEMLTGQLPFQGPNFLAQKREGLFTPAGALVAGLPKPVDAFFQTALAPEPSKRFATAAALAAGAEAAS